MLEIKDLHVHYGGIHAVQGVSMRIPQGRIVTLIGANGAGKTTLIRALLGQVEYKGVIRGRIRRPGTAANPGRNSSSGNPPRTSSGGASR